MSFLDLLKKAQEQKKAPKPIPSASKPKPRRRAVTPVDVKKEFRGIGRTPREVYEFFYFVLTGKTVRASKEKVIRLIISELQRRISKS